LKKRRTIKILFPCIGRRVVLLRLFQQACRRQGCQSVIIGADADENSPALQCCDRKHIAYPVVHSGHVRQMLEVVKREKVDLLVPTVDLDLPIWAKYRDKLAGWGCTAIISSERVVQICQDKRRMYRFLSNHGFDTPETVSATQALRRKRHKFPYFLKPWDGHASRGNYMARNVAELKFFAQKVPNCIVQEFIEGEEHTVDVLVDFEGRVRCVVPRRRLEVRAGEVSKAVTVKHPEIMRQSQELIEVLGAGPGVITIQCFLTNRGGIKFIEINPRFGGGAPLSVKAGADFPRWLVQLWMGKNPRIKMDGWRDRLAMSRYDDAVWYQK
jgi:carbamoyl-phosphate synthase large subunit